MNSRKIFFQCRSCPNEVFFELGAEGVINPFLLRDFQLPDLQAWFDKHEHNNTHIHSEFPPYSLIYSKEND